MTFKIGNTIFIEEQDDDICEMCGAAKELRPYGPFDEAKGRRLNVCFPCGMKDKAGAQAAFGELLDGKTQ